jgi:hypothetical protein
VQFRQHKGQSNLDCSACIRCGSSCSPQGMHVCCSLLQLATRANHNNPPKPSATSPRPSVLLVYLNKTTCTAGEALTWMHCKRQGWLATAQAASTRPCIKTVAQATHVTLWLLSAIRTHTSVEARCSLATTSNAATAAVATSTTADMVCTSYEAWSVAHAHCCTPPPRQQPPSAMLLMPQHSLCCCCDLLSTHSPHARVARVMVC